MLKKPKHARGPDATKTRNKIIAAAKKLFVKQGFNGTSLRQIAEKAKVTQSLLHHHFGSKAALWQMTKAELMNQYFNEIEERIKSKSTKSGDTDHFMLDKALEYRFRFMQDNPDVVKMLLWQFLDKHDYQVKGRGRDLIKNLLQSLEDGQEQGYIRNDIDPAYIAVSIFVLTSGWFQQKYDWIMKESKSSSLNREEANDAYLEAIQKILANGIVENKTK